MKHASAAERLTRVGMWGAVSASPQLHCDSFAEGAVTQQRLEEAGEYVIGGNEGSGSPGYDNIYSKTSIAGSSS